MIKKSFLSIIFTLLFLSTSSFATLEKSLLPDSELVKNEDSMFMLFDKKIVSIAYCDGNIFSGENPIYFPIDYLNNFKIKINIDQKTKYITLSKDDIWVKFKVGNKKIYTNNGEQTLKYAPIEKNGKTYMFIGEKVPAMFDLLTDQHHIAKLKISKEWAKKKKYPDTSFDSDGSNFSVIYTQMIPKKYGFETFEEYYDTFGHMISYYIINGLPVNEGIFEQNNLYLSSNLLLSLFKELYSTEDVFQKDGFLVVDLSKFNENIKSSFLKINLNDMKVIKIDDNAVETEVKIKTLFDNNNSYICINDLLDNMSIFYTSVDTSPNNINNKDKVTNYLKIFPKKYEHFEFGYDIFKEKRYTGKSLLSNDKTNLDMLFLYNLYNKFVPKKVEAYVSVNAIGIGYKNTANERYGYNILDLNWDEVYAGKPSGKNKQTAIRISNYYLEENYKELVNAIVDSAVSSEKDEKVIKNAINTFYQSKNKNIIGKWQTAPNGTKYLFDLSISNEPNIVIVLK